MSHDRIVEQLEDLLRRLNEATDAAEAGRIADQMALLDELRVRTKVDPEPEPPQSSAGGAGDAAGLEFWRDIFSDGMLDRIVAAGKHPRGVAHVEGISLDKAKLTFRDGSVLLLDRR